MLGQTTESLERFLTKKFAENEHDEDTGSEQMLEVSQLDSPAGSDLSDKYNDELDDVRSDCFSGMVDEDGNESDDMDADVDTVDESEPMLASSVGPLNYAGICATQVHERLAGETKQQVSPATSGRRHQQTSVLARSNHQRRTQMSEVYSRDTPVEAATLAGRRQLSFAIDKLLN